MTSRRVCTLGITLLLCLVAWLGDATRVSAQSGDTIREIRIDGTQRIDPETVRSYMRVSVGDSFDPVQLNDSLKDIFKPGLFADVKLRREGDVLVVLVVENPIINRFEFEGNDRLEDDDRLGWNDVLEAHTGILDLGDEVEVSSIGGVA